MVVGVDGSPGSEGALRWAAKQAQLTGAELHAITSWQTPSAYGYYVDYSDADAAAEAQKTLEQVISKSLGTPPSVPVVTSVVKGQPAEVLVEASRSAELLVVGSRGRGTFTAMLLGSVSQHCVQHAACTVVVVRPPQKTDTRQGTE
ncbi:universal stress protein [Mycobacterium helveticum]|uniref:Universal stress protein n=1 Tax=Mycobacterium helveticum TaxID=2592811 RepID=A0A557XXX6_9MYCO|nr:universal stress protein [Mycobacterium helveticum]TVS91001.1 universal stress protein [Mycobacterium helveticum]